MFRELRRLKSQPLKNDCVNVRGCVFVCARGYVYFFPKVETHFHKHCYMGEAKATAGIYCPSLSVLFLLLLSFLKCPGYYWGLCYTLLSECQSCGNCSPPCPRVTWAPVLFGAIVAESRVKVAYKERGCRDLITPPVTGGDLPVLTIAGSMGHRQMARGHFTACLFGSVPFCPTVPRHLFGRGE